MNKQQRTKYVVHYKEAPDSIQWDKEFREKIQADRFAAEITFNGGMAIVVTEYEDDDIIIGFIKGENDES